MNVDADDVLEHGAQLLIAGRGPGVFAIVGDGGSEEAAGAAGGVERGGDAVGRQHFGDDALAEPVGRVILAQPVPLGGVDELLVDVLEHVLPETREVVGAERGHRHFPERGERVGDVELRGLRPAEEVIINDVGQAALAEPRAAEDVADEVVGADGLPPPGQGGPGEQAGKADKIGVAKEKVFEGFMAAGGGVGVAKVALPGVERGGGLAPVAAGFPGGAKARSPNAPDDGIGAEVDGEQVGRGDGLLLAKEQGLEPEIEVGQGVPRAAGFDLQIAQGFAERHILGRGRALVVVGERWSERLPAEAVGCDCQQRAVRHRLLRPDAGGVFAKLILGVSAGGGEAALELDDGVTVKGVDRAATRPSAAEIDAHAVFRAGGHAPDGV